MEHTTNSSNYLYTPAVGYIVNAMLSDSASVHIERLQGTLMSAFPNAIWATPKNSLHVTLFDCLAPLVDYGNDKDRLFEELFPEYDAALTTILRDVAPIKLTFNRVILSPTAIAIATDNSSAAMFNEIRQKFLAQVNLLPNTKLPPNIVHSTIIRFVEEIPMDDVHNIAQSLSLSFTEAVPEFQLVRESKLPLLDFSVVKKYPLLYTAS